MPVSLPRNPQDPSPSLRRMPSITATPMVTEPMWGGFAGGKDRPVMGQFKDGGEVPETGVYKMEKGEHVMNAGQKEHAKKAVKHMARAFSLAESHGESKEPPAKKGKKLKEVHVRRAHNGGFIMHHKHHAPHNMQEHDEEHTATNPEEMAQHMMNNQPETAPAPATPMEAPGIAQALASPAGAQ